MMMMLMMKKLMKLMMMMMMMKMMMMMMMMVTMTMTMAMTTTMTMTTTTTTTAPAPPTTMMSKAKPSAKVWPPTLGGHTLAATLVSKFWPNCGAGAGVERCSKICQFGVQNLVPGRGF